MLTIAYLAVQFPSPVEPYVGDEIAELRSRGVHVIAGSVKRSGADAERAAQIVLRPLSLFCLIQGLWMCMWRWRRISSLTARILLRGPEGPMRRLKALFHTWLGACYAVKLRRCGEVDHIHAHHGYCASWISMVAARLLGTGFSMTLHGSDLLVRADYLDVKLDDCAFCLTVSEYNRQYLLECFPQVEPGKVIVSRLGVDLPARALEFFSRDGRNSANLTLLTVGRLHKIKGHEFLIRACAHLQQQGIGFECVIAGDGPERRHLERLIHKLGLEDKVTLLGHIAREQMDSLYDRADVVALTSRSEGIPLVLMEAMARGKIVLAPAITGIPELVQHRRTGFLYEAGSMEDFLRRLMFVQSFLQSELQLKLQAKTGLNRNPRTRHPLLPPAKYLDWVRFAAHVQVRHNFNRTINLKSFSELFLPRIAMRSEPLHENSVLQQIQLSLQRNRGLPLRIDATDAGAGPRSRPVFHG
jgi:colanic acid/amylovoran biosynthesis glycosyltransferase